MAGILRALRVFGASVSMTWLTMACGGAALPQQELTSAEAAVRAAEVAGAPAVPKAELHLKYARDQITQAKQMIEQGENEQAQRVLVKAESDAEVALALAKHEEARSEANKALEDIEALMEKK